MEERKESAREKIEGEEREFFFFLSFQNSYL